MYLIIKNGYSTIGIPVTNEIGQLLMGMEKAVSLKEPGWKETNYKVNEDEVVTFTIVPDNCVGDPVVERYKEDLDRAYQREVEEREARKKLEVELKELKERFSPFMKDDE